MERKDVLIGGAAAAAAAVALISSGCRKQAVRTAEVVAIGVGKLPSEPSDAAWDSAPEHLAKLVPQDLVEPRLMKATTGEVMVRALAAGSEIAFRLEWADGDRSEVPGPARMCDACAVQVPQVMAAEPPAPQMGEEGKPVQVTYWRADWQASVNGRGDTIRDLYPNAQVDHYPFEAKPLDSDPAAKKEMALRYAPARALGNIRSGPRSSPVEDAEHTVRVPWIRLARTARSGCQGRWRSAAAGVCRLCTHACIAGNASLDIWPRRARVSARGYLHQRHSAWPSVVRNLRVL
jgi:hypothetical protein